MLTYPFPCCQNQAPPGMLPLRVVRAAYEKSPSFQELSFALCLAVRTRLELATPCVTGMYSNQTELPDRFVAFQFPVESECKDTNIFLIHQIFF